MSNLLEAICNIYELELIEIQHMDSGHNRMNNQGDGLELFIKDAFSNNLEVNDEAQRILNYRNTFSYIGGSTTPPDLMLRGSDAIEVKKTLSIGSDLQLNSSHPKNYLNAASNLINNHCRNCEEWIKKDMLYTVGHINREDKSLSSLWFVYGDVYAADEPTYLNLKSNIQRDMSNYGDLDGNSPTNELGRINGVDPLQITNLRVRGMWLLKPPFRVYNYICQYDRNSKFQIFAILSECKFNSFPSPSRERFEALLNDEVKIEDVQINDPNNPANTIKGKLITINKA